jgi:hypothetical protein
MLKSGQLAPKERHLSLQLVHLEPTIGTIQSQFFDGVFKLSVDGLKPVTNLCLGRLEVLFLTPLVLGQLLDLTLGCCDVRAELLAMPIGYTTAQDYEAERCI